MCVSVRGSANPSDQSLPDSMLGVECSMLDGKFQDYRKKPPGVEPRGFWVLLTDALFDFVLFAPFFDDFFRNGERYGFVALELH